MDTGDADILSGFQVYGTGNCPAPVAQQLHELGEGFDLNILLDTSRPPLVDLARSILELDKQGTLEIRPSLDTGPHPDPGEYVSSYERRWPDLGDWFDFLHPDSPAHALKDIQRRIYLQQLGQWLEALPADAAIVDAGCGIGRFIGDLQAAGRMVHGVDGSPSALKRLVAHALRNNWDLDRLQLNCSPLDRLRFLDDESVDACFCIETICYIDHPEHVLAEFLRILRPGGMLAVSVEALVGAVCADHRIPAVEIPEVMSRARCRIDDDYDVTYYTTESLYGLIEAAGFGDIEIQTSHFVVDGPFQNRLEQLDLSDPKTVEKIIQLDIHMSGVPDLAGLGRVLLATARKPEQP